MSLALVIDAAGLRSVAVSLEGVMAGGLASLLEDVGAEVESQTRRRIQSEKTAPNGEAWDPWSESYAETRHGGHSLLQGEGALLDSIQHLVEGNETVIGSNMVYARAQQEGNPKQNLPAREYLGLSPENVRDVDDVMNDWLKRRLLRAVAA